MTSTQNQLKAKHLFNSMLKYRKEQTEELFSGGFQ